MEWANTTLQMALCMMGNGCKINDAGKAEKSGQMELCLKELT